MRWVVRWSLAYLAGFIIAWLLVIPVQGQELPSKLVKADWLTSTFGKFEVRIVDVRPDIRDYWTSHLPGAVYVNVESLRWPENGEPIKLMPVSALVQFLGQLGISPTTPVVIYAEKNGFLPSYFLWVLDYVGHTNCGALDGGFETWKAEGRALTQDYPLKIRSVVYPVPQKMNAEVRASLEDVQQSRRPGFVLIDSRPNETYTGEKGAWKRRGHIPGAISHFWNTDLNADGSWKSKEELRRQYAEQGATSDKKVIVYCGSGEMSSHAYFVLKHILGFPWVKNYDAGFSQWSGNPQLAVEESAK